MSLSPERRAALAEFYTRVDAFVAARRPRCELSGRCCDFERSEHELWATELEVAFARETSDGPVPAVPSGRCPWYVDGLCQHRRGRPLGCRLYFCDPGWADEMPRAYERFHAELAAMSDGPYAYRRFVDAVPLPPDPAP